MMGIAKHGALVQQVIKSAFAESFAVPERQIAAKLIDRDLQNQFGRGWRLRSRLGLKRYQAGEGQNKVGETEGHHGLGSWFAAWSSQFDEWLVEGRLVMIWYSASPMR
ncbi:MAG: hypothetical protein P8L85_23870 [Rubripirellula sp.]|nr:hypothetical protein [Rubripirellula sp.]